MRRVRPTGPRLLRAAALAAAIAALALTLRASPLLIPFLAVAALALGTPFAEWERAPGRLVRLLPRLAEMALLVVALLAWLSRSLGIIALDPPTLASLGGLLVVPISLAFALAPAAFPPGRTQVPTTVCLLALAGLDPSPDGYGTSSLPFLAGADHSSFAEVYLAFALVALASLWAAALVESGPRWHRREALWVAFAAVLAAGLAATGIVGLPLLQPRVERAFAEALSAGRTGLSGESTLGEFAELAVSRRRVLDLVSSQADAGPWLLRAEVFTTFDGRRWRNPPPPRPPKGRRQAAPKRLLSPTTPPVPPGSLLAETGAWFVPASAVAPVGGRPQLELRFVQADVEAWPLLLPRRVSAVTADASFLEIDRFGTLRRPSGVPLSLYGAMVPEVLSSRTSDSPPPPSAEELEESLSVPVRLDERVSALARSLAPADASPRERLDATLAHLHAGYAYTLAPGRFRSADPLAEFLFEKKAAYCEYFASAAVVLLRLQGVPARFVKGLSAGPQTDQGGGLHVVRESDAHAWVEAYLPTEGWVEADATPPGALAAAHGGPGAVERTLQRARAAAAAAWAYVTGRGPLALLRRLGRDLVPFLVRVVREPLAWSTLALLLVAPRLARLLRRGRREAPREEGAPVSAELAGLVRGLEGRWRAAGRPRPPGRGLLEHARAVARPGTGVDEAPLPPALAEASLALVTAYYRARFGGEAPAGEEIERLRAGLGA